MLFIENQNKDNFFIINENCIIKLDEGNSIHRIYIKFVGGETRELARYVSHSKAEKIYRELLKYLTMDKQFKTSYFTMPEDIN